MNWQEISYPLTNEVFLKVVSNSFYNFLQSETSRSTAKLKPLHGAIAKDLHQRLGGEYKVLSQGYDEDREGVIEGRYVQKRVDITVTKEDKPVAGLAVKFIMQNYSQNSNNYFENMLGETANIRANNCPYFQILIILDKIPYYKKDKSISRWENFTERNAKKYQHLSNDNIDAYFHTPNKTLIYLVHIPDNPDLRSQSDYMDFYKGLEFSVTNSSERLSNTGAAVVQNDYETFIEKVYHSILAQ